MCSGGQPVADALAQLLNRPLLPAETSVWPVQADGRPQRMKAIIREDECIGCTKCINACPVDAIIGSGKLMHTILTDLCTGCELCIPPCPVDCIDLVEDTQALPSEQQRIAEQNDLRQRYYAHIQREENAVFTAKALLYVLKSIPSCLHSSLKHLMIYLQFSSSRSQKKRL